MEIHILRIYFSTQMIVQSVVSKLEHCIELRGKKGDCMPLKHMVKIWTKKIQTVYENLPHSYSGQHWPGSLRRRGTSQGPHWGAGVRRKYPSLDKN